MLTEEQSKLVEQYHKLAMKISNQYYDKNVSMLMNKKLERGDIDQITNIWLCTLAKRFDSTKGKFSTYLYNLLEVSVSREVEQYNIVKIPVRYAWERGNAEEYMGVMYGGIEELDKSLPSSVADDLTVMDTIADDDIDNPIDSAIINNILNKSLDEKNVQIVKMTVGGYLQKEIAEKLGISIPTVKFRLGRSRKILREELELAGVM